MNTLAHLPEPVLQRPDLNVLRVEPADPTTASRGIYPWLSQDVIEIPTVRVHTPEGKSFRYGSLVKGNGSIAKLAGVVPPEQSGRAEEALFRALPLIFDGSLPPAIDRVTSLVNGAEVPVFKVAKKGPDAPRLYFSWLKTDEDPIVLKLAVVQHKKQDELRSLMQRGAKRRKHDGGHQ